MGLRLHVEALAVHGEGRKTLLEIPRLDVEPGGCIGIRGPSGAGKSTLLFTLAGLLSAASGAIRWGETDLLGLGEDARAAFRRAHIGMVFQDYLLFEELGPAANAGLAASFAPSSRRTSIAERAMTMLGRLGVPADAHRTIATFSGGERQRIAVARALAGDPAIILADEPTASLDRDTADRLIEDLAALVRADGKTLIAVSHDAGLLERMDRIVTLADGRIVPGDGNA